MKHDASAVDVTRNGGNDYAALVITSALHTPCWFVE